VATVLQFNLLTVLNDILLTPKATVKWKVPLFTDYQQTNKQTNVLSK
jgi:hypothetical protein